VITHQNRWKWVKTTNAIGVASAMLLFTFSVPRAHADRDDRKKCEHQIEKAESRLDQAIRKHGPHSEEAYERRRDLNAERDRCWSDYHGWWDGRAHQWHEQRDWDRDDHDRDDHDRDHR